MIPGVRIHDRYILQALLGRGGMAEVWGATDERLNREVAVKFLAPQMAEDPEYLVRFFSANSYPNPRRKGTVEQPWSRRGTRTRARRGETRTGPRPDR